jgi:hypothetical protein
MAVDWNGIVHAAIYPVVLQRSLEQIPVGNADDEKVEDVGAPREEPQRAYGCPLQRLGVDSRDLEASSVRLVEMRQLRSQD